MSPRHFAKLMENPIYNKEIVKKIQPGMNLWYSFFAISGLDTTINKLFTYTPKEIVNNPVKDSQSGS